MMKPRLLAIALLALAAQTAFARPSVPPPTIAPGEVWRDTSGTVIQAHGGGMLQVGKTWYWFGENRAPAPPGQRPPAVTCYSSTDLVHWQFRQNSLVRQASGDLAAGRVIERPKVLYNRATRTFVMYLHIDSPNYGEAKVGVATCNRVDGNYTYRGSFNPSGHQSRDMTLFQDPDGTGYLIYEDRARGAAIARLSPDYLSVDREVCLIPHALEAAAVVKVGPTYFLLGSHLSGWNANDNEYATATTLAGPWSEFKNVAPAGARTYESQTAFILPVRGSQTTSYIYVGDRWKPSDLQDSRYIWLPLHIDGQAMSLAAPAPWTIDAATGIVKEQK